MVIVHKGLSFGVVMIALLSNAAALERGFTFCAILGGVLLVVRVVLMFFAADLDELGAETDSDFRLLSLQGVMAFLLIFGLSGRAFLLETEMGHGAVFAAALASGIGAMWVMGWLFAMMHRLQDSGNVDLNRAIGAKGTVYLTIPAGGSGEVQVIFSGKQQIHDAIAEDDLPIETGARVEVVATRGSNTLVVKRDADVSG